jgi:hypothetical protein
MPAAQTIRDEVARLGRRLDGLHERPLRPSDSLSLGVAEREQVRRLLEQFRQLPGDEQQRQARLLHEIGKLEVAAGDFTAAKRELEEAAELAEDGDGKAAAHFDAFRAALEARDLDAAFAAQRAAVRLGGERFALFPEDRYEPERFLGAGGFGVAALCRHRHSGGRVVVKTLHADDLGRDLAEVFAEASALEALEHPAVIRLRDCGFVDAARARPYLVMDYFDGPTLEEHVRRHGPLDREAALAVGRQVAEGLAAAHAKGILHRDVKPANLLVRRDGDAWRVKLIDFGLALRPRALRDTFSNADALSKTVLGGSVAGTLDYAAPEQLGRLPGVAVGPRSDLYGFARTVCFALFGTPHPEPLRFAELGREPWAEALSRCLAERPEGRPDGLAALLAAWPPAGREAAPLPALPADEEAAWQQAFRAGTTEGGARHDL